MLSFPLQSQQRFFWILEAFVLLVFPHVEDQLHIWGWAVSVCSYKPGCVLLQQVLGPGVKLLSCQLRGKAAPAELGVGLEGCWEHSGLGRAHKVGRVQKTEKLVHAPLQTPKQACVPAAWNIWNKWPARGWEFAVFMYSAMATAEEVMGWGSELVESTNDITD